MQRAIESRESKVKMQKHIRKQQLAEFTLTKEKVAQKILFNKSSSSGTTTNTSSSAATAEFLARLRQMEMPALRRPSGSDVAGRQKSLGDSELNTSVDLALVKELESSSFDLLEHSRKTEQLSTPSFSSLELTDSGEAEEDKEEVATISLSSSTSDSSHK